jgi:hypothetical protein
MHLTGTHCVTSIKADESADGSLGVQASMSHMGRANLRVGEQQHAVTWLSQNALKADSAPLVSHLRVASNTHHWYYGV